MQWQICPHRYPKPTVAKPPPAAVPGSIAMRFVPIADWWVSGSGADRPETPHTSP
jgi:hypothetical protein